MPTLTREPPYTKTEFVTDILHGVTVTDPYRWLEDSESVQTRSWIVEQNAYARSILDALPGRDRIRERIREFLAVETYDSVQIIHNRCYFRKRLAEQEQPCIYMRETPEGEDQLLIDPSERGTGSHTAVKPLSVYSNGRFLLYEVKEGGEKTGTFELFDIKERKCLSDVLPRGYLRGLAFAPDAKSFYYAHESVDIGPQFDHTAYRHVIGTPFTEDQEVFCARDNQNIRLTLWGDDQRLMFYVQRLGEKTLTDIYLRDIQQEFSPPTLIFRDIDYQLMMRFLPHTILAITDQHSPNRRIVEIRLDENEVPEVIEIVQESDAPIRNWLVTKNHIFVSYLRQMSHQICIFDYLGHKVAEIPIRADETVRLITASPEQEDILFEAESFAEPIGIYRFSMRDKKRTTWAKPEIPFDSSEYVHSQVWYASKDGTNIPMFLVGRRDVLAGTQTPTIMTSYGGYGTSMTPQFSVFVAFLMEQGCLFALPNIRGGSEFGRDWHNAAIRRKRQTAFDDFLSAAEWLLESGRTHPSKLAIFGGSNSGLLVGAALTQRPGLFRAVVCLVPLLDMLRYHKFDNAYRWNKEFGTADDPKDFETLMSYSPYHRVSEPTQYPAVMLVSGDADGNCNPLHARKMTARLQAANASSHPIILDYSSVRGHSPVLPLTTRIDALTDRMAFICDQLGLTF
jgi:prolyl oligopeptidase